MPTNEPRLWEVDEELLDLLAEGRVTPAYAKSRLKLDGHRDVSSSYVGERLRRLDDLGIVDSLLGCSLYELNEDPRQEEA